MGRSQAVEDGPGLEAVERVSRQLELGSCTAGPAALGQVGLENPLPFVSAMETEK